MDQAPIRALRSTLSTPLETLTAIRSLAVLAAFVALAAAAPARAEKLWLELPTGQRALAEVPSVSPVVAAALPAVVSLAVDQPAEGGEENPLEQFYRFFGNPREEPRTNRGVGSGFIINPAGYILTNSHVVEKAQRITAHLAGDLSDRAYPAEVVGLDLRTDVALLKIRPEKPLPVIPLGHSANLALGDWVIALGNPLNLGQSASVGIVSATNRRDVQVGHPRGLYDFIQSDVSIHPGNSGGPLINLRGEAVGLNAAINAVWPRIGFAIPIDMIKEIIPQLKATGQVSRGWLGVFVQRVDAMLAQSVGLDRARGAIITEVVADSPAAKGGVLPGDVLLAINGDPVRDYSDVKLMTGRIGAGRLARIELLRNSKRLTLDVTLAPSSDSTAAPAAPAAARSFPKDRLGFIVSDIDQSGRSLLELPARGGVLVKEVEQGSPAAEAGLEVGDLVLELDGASVATAADFAAAVRQAEVGKLLRLRVRRKGGAFRYVILPAPVPTRGR